MTDSFSLSYSDARHKFLGAARDAGARIATYDRSDLTGAQGESLACDVAVLGDDASPAAALVICGTHGSEGLCGSAILHRWLAGRAGDARPEPTKIVLVHAINPWAFSHRTRATENNVDLNRNFLETPEDFARASPAYDRLAPFYHADMRDAEAQLAAWRGLNACIAEHGPHIERESWEGQGTWPDGICYTGSAPEWSNRTFRQILRDHLAESRHVGFIDWHTGIGAYGEIVHLVFDAPGSAAHDAATGWWRLARAAGDSARPAYRGILWSSIRAELPRATVAGAVIEYGTADSYAMFRGDCLDRWLRFEGRGDPDADKLRRDYMATCCPQDVLWQRLVLRTGPAQIDMMLAGLARRSG